MLVSTCPGRPMIFMRVVLIFSQLMLIQGVERSFAGSDICAEGKAYCHPANYSSCIAVGEPKECPGEKICCEGVSGVVDPSRSEGYPKGPSEDEEDSYEAWRSRLLREAPATSRRTLICAALLRDCGSAAARRNCLVWGGRRCALAVQRCNGRSCLCCLFPPEEAGEAGGVDGLGNDGEEDVGQEIKDVDVEVTTQLDSSENEELLSPLLGIDHTHHVQLNINNMKSPEDEAGNTDLLESTYGVEGSSEPETGTENTDILESTSMLKDAFESETETGNVDVLESTSRPEYTSEPGNIEVLDSDSRLEDTSEPETEDGNVHVLENIFILDDTSGPGNIEVLDNTSRLDDTSEPETEDGNVHILENISILEDTSEPETKTGNVDVLESTSRLEGTSEPGNIEVLDSTSRLEDISEPETEAENIDILENISILEDTSELDRKTGDMDVLDNIHKLGDTFEPETETLNIKLLENTSRVDAYESERETWNTSVLESPSGVEDTSEHETEHGKTNVLGNTSRLEDTSEIHTEIETGNMYVLKDTSIIADISEIITTGNISEPDHNDKLYSVSVTDRNLESTDDAEAIGEANTSYRQLIELPTTENLDDPEFATESSDDSDLVITDSKYDSGYYDELEQNLSNNIEIMDHSDISTKQALALEQNPTITKVDGEEIIFPRTQASAILKVASNAVQDLQSTSQYQNLTESVNDKGSTPQILKNAEIILDFSAVNSTYLEHSTEDYTLEEITKQMQQADTMAENQQLIESANDGGHLPEVKGEQNILESLKIKDEFSESIADIPSSTEHVPPSYDDYQLENENDGLPKSEAVTGTEHAGNTTDEDYDFLGLYAVDDIFSEVSTTSYDSSESSSKIHDHLESDNEELLLPETTPGFSHFANASSDDEYYVASDYYDQNLPTLTNDSQYITGPALNNTQFSESLYKEVNTIESTTNIQSSEFIATERSSLVNVNEYQQMLETTTIEPYIDDSTVTQHPLTHVTKKNVVSGLSDENQDAHEPVLYYENQTSVFQGTDGNDSSAKMEDISVYSTENISESLTTQKYLENTARFSFYDMYILNDTTTVKYSTKVTKHPEIKTHFTVTDEKSGAFSSTENAQDFHNTHLFNTDAFKTYNTNNKVLIDIPGPLNKIRFTPLTIPIKSDQSSSNKYSNLIDSVQWAEYGPFLIDPNNHTTQSLASSTPESQTKPNINVDTEATTQRPASVVPHHLSSTEDGNSWSPEVYTITPLYGKLTIVLFTKDILFATGNVFFSPVKGDIAARGQIIGSITGSSPVNVDGILTLTVYEESSVNILSSDFDLSLRTPGRLGDTKLLASCTGAMDKVIVGDDSVKIKGKVSVRWSGAKTGSETGVLEASITRNDWNLF